MKIQPIDFKSPPAAEAPATSARLEPAAKPPAKSRLKRLFERQFTSVIRISAENPGGDYCSSGGELEPNSACLVKMVQNFIEGSSERPYLYSSSSAASWVGRHASVDDSELLTTFCDANKKAHSSLEGCEILKGLVVCASVAERSLLADTARIVDRNSKNCKRNDEICRVIITNGLLTLGYDASVCKSRWEKSSSCPPGEYEYVDVIVEGERYLIDVDFRSEFEIARPTKAYKAIIQILPQIYVGKSDRLQKIVSVVSDAAKQSLRKKGMPVPPWRRRDYVASKWLASHARRADEAPARGFGAEPVAVSRFEEWVSLPRRHVGFGVKKKTTAGLASVMMDD